MNQCPYCGGDAELDGGTGPLKGDILKWWVYCSECGARGRADHYVTKAIQEWNRIARAKGEQ